MFGISAGEGKGLKKARADNDLAYPFLPPSQVSMDEACRLLEMTREGSAFEHPSLLVTRFKLDSQTSSRVGLLTRMSSMAINGPGTLTAEERAKICTMLRELCRRIPVQQPISDPLTMPRCSYCR